MEIVRLEYGVVARVAPKPVSNVCAMTLATIKNIVAAEYIVVESSEAVAPKCGVEVPQTPHEAKRIRNRLVKKVSVSDFACA